FDEAELQNVFGDIRTAGHTQRVAVQRVAVTRNERLERVPITAKDALNDELISVVLINHVLISPQGRFRRLHDNRVTRFSRFGQGASSASRMKKGCHVARTNLTVVG